MNERRPRGKSEAQGIEAQGIEAVPPEMREGWQSGEAHITPVRNLSRREKKLFKNLFEKERKGQRRARKYLIPAMGVFLLGFAVIVVNEEGFNFWSVGFPIGSFILLLLYGRRTKRKVASYTTEAPVAEIEGELTSKMYSAPNSFSATVGGIEVLFPRAWGTAFYDLHDCEAKAEVYLVGSERYVLSLEGEGKDGTRHERSLEQDLRRRRISPEDGRDVFGVPVEE